MHESIDVIIIRIYECARCDRVQPLENDISIIDSSSLRLSKLHFVFCVQLSLK